MAETLNSTACKTPLTKAQMTTARNSTFVEYACKQCYRRKVVCQGLHAQCFYS